MSSESHILFGPEEVFVNLKVKRCIKLIDCICHECPLITHRRQNVIRALVALLGMFRIMHLDFLTCFDTKKHVQDISILSVKYSGGATSGRTKYQLKKGLSNCPYHK